MTKRFRVTRLRDAFTVYQTEVAAETEDAAWQFANAAEFTGRWQRQDVLEFDHTERGPIEELDADVADAKTAEEDRPWD